MNYTENIKKLSKDKWNMTYLRFKSAVIIFTLMTFLFFLNFYLLWSNFYNESFKYEYMIIVFPYLYIGLLVSFVFLFFYTLKYKFSKWNVWKINIVFWIFIFIILLVSILVIFWKDVFSDLLNSWKNLFK